MTGSGLRSPRRNPRCFLVVSLFDALAGELHIPIIAHNERKPM
jgi:hypothetical protein